MCAFFHCMGGVRAHNAFMAQLKTEQTEWVESWMMAIDEQQVPRIINAYRIQTENGTHKYLFISPHAGTTHKRTDWHFYGFPFNGSYRKWKYERRRNVYNVFPFWMAAMFSPNLLPRVGISTKMQWFFFRMKREYIFSVPNLNELESISFASWSIFFFLMSTFMVRCSHRYGLYLLGYPTRSHYACEYRNDLPRKRIHFHWEYVIML